MSVRLQTNLFPSCPRPSLLIFYIINSIIIKNIIILGFLSKIASIPTRHHQHRTTSTAPPAPRQHRASTTSTTSTTTSSSNVSSRLTIHPVYIHTLMLLPPLALYASQYGVGRAAINCPRGLAFFFLFLFGLSSDHVSLTFW